MAGNTAPGSTIPMPPVKGAGDSAPVVPFRLATLERTELQTALQQTLSANQQSNQTTIEGTGFMYGIGLDTRATAAGNAANVAYHEDAPYSALALVTLDDPSGQIVNLTGYDLFLANLAHKQYAVQSAAQATWEGYGLVTGAGATGGSFSFFARVPVGINRRTLLGILGNQDRSVRYQLRTDLAAGGVGPIYTTAPTNQPSIIQDRIYENYAFPAPVGPGGRQEMLPPSFGTISYLTSTFSEAPPQGGSTGNHYLRRLGNTIRYVVLVFRYNGSRSAVTTNPPTRLSFKIGDADLFTETYRYRRALMFERFGFNWPDGVLIYDAEHDFVPGAGSELGMDWYNTQNINTAQFQITYPTAAGSTNNSLKFITSDMMLTGQPVA